MIFLSLLLVVVSTSFDEIKMMIRREFEPGGQMRQNKSVNHVSLEFCFAPEVSILSSKTMPGINVCLLTRRNRYVKHQFEFVN